MMWSAIMFRKTGEQPAFQLPRRGRGSDGVCARTGGTNAIQVNNRGEFRPCDLDLPAYASDVTLDL